jgi:hypothetical protein
MQAKQVDRTLASTKPQKFNQRTVSPRDRERRTIGFGVKPDETKIKAANAGLGAGPKAAVKTGLGDLVDAVRNSVACPIWNMPVIESSRGTVGGPSLDQDLPRLFGAKINPFGWNDSTSGIDSLDTTLAQNGETQTPMLVCAVGWKLQPEPLCFTAEGNAWTAPAGPAAQPFSPDVFTLNDIANAFSAAIADSTEVFDPAVLEWGWWANYACWHMVRGYHLRWMIGQHTNIFDESLRNTAYMPPNAQEGSASDSQVDVNNFVARMNQRYLTILGSSLIFLKGDTLRLGSATIGGVNTGIFRPSRANEFVGATYGGMDLRSMLNGNSEFKKLTVPYFLNAGIPIGLYAQESDQFQADIMRDYMSATQGLETTVPPLLFDSQNITATTQAFSELTLDATPVPVDQTMPAGRRLFKGGDLKIEVDIKGFEVDEDWFNVLKNNSELRDAFMCECGCAWPK